MISERRACRLVGLSRDALRHPPQPDSQTVRLAERIQAIALELRRFGYRRVHDMLRGEFPGTNHKKVFRLYREQGLAVCKRNKGKKYRGARTPLVAATQVNQTWSLDFVSDSLGNGRLIKCLTIADDFSHECIEIAVDLSMPGAYVTRVLERAVRFRGYPQPIRTDNGPEFTCGAFMAWMQSRGIQHILIQRASPRRTPTSKVSTASSGMNVSTRTGSNHWPWPGMSSPSGARTTTRFARMERLAAYRRLRTRPCTAASKRSTTTQDQLTCKPLGLSPTDWYG
jgi:Integrase core domain/HTH-like domain